MLARRPWSARHELRPTPRFGVIEQPGLLVATHDGVELRADAFIPDGEGPFPAFVLVHGGAFVKGDRSSYAPWGRFLATRGYAALSASYRLATAERATYPEAIWDIKAAVQHLRGAAAGLRVDPGKIGIIGGSAGGYLAAMVALTANDPAFANPYPDPFRDVSAAVSVAVPMAGLMDLVACWEFDRVSRPPADQPLERYLGGTPLTQRRRYYEASPVFHASAANAKGTRWLIAWGLEDEVVPPVSNSKALVGELQLAGALVRVAPIPGAGHFWYMEGEVEAPGSMSAKLAPRLLGFLRTWSGW
jgi:acetyl esterase/lipase